MSAGSPTASALGPGIIGAGGFATFLADALASLPGITLRAVADARQDAAHRGAETLSSTHVPAR